jgi:hypothetical protein
LDESLFLAIIERVFYNISEVIHVKKACEVLTVFREDGVYPLRFRYYSIEDVEYLTVDVERIEFIRTRNRNGLVEKTYVLTGKRKQKKDTYALYQNPRDKSWWLVS